MAAAFAPRQIDAVPVGDRAHGVGVATIRR